MRKSLWLLFILGITLSVFPQQLKEESVVINIEVPVRVFTGDRFVDHLTINDFELYEDGIPQNIEAVYLVKKRSIERSEEKKRFSPDTARNFYLFFEVSEYSAKLGMAVQHFVNNVLDPGDLLTIVTPVKTYRLRGKALEVKSREAVTSQLKGLLRKDAMTGNSEYRSVLQDLSSLAQALAAEISQDDTLRVSSEFSQEKREGETVGEQLARYEELLSRLEFLREVNQSRLLDFAKYLEDKEGQKYVYLFYQREYIPQIEPRILDQYIHEYQDNPNIQQTISNVFEFFRRDITFDIEVVKQAYANSSISIHFLFISSPIQDIYGIRFQERSEDIFSAFDQMAKATGGYIQSSANPESLFRKALESAENYYLLYYTPRNYRRDGAFRNIRVAVKEGGYRLTHRVGYFAN
jgi:hypothetical protein